jgi:ComF family protein
MRQLFATLLAFLYPPYCLGCKVVIPDRGQFCVTCTKLLKLIHSPLCLCCGIPFTTAAGPDHLCKRCLASLPSFRRARAWACYKNGDIALQPLSVAIQHFKYHRNLSTGKALAVLAASHFPFEGKEYDVIVPVPLHITRLRWRGFNQSFILARAIGDTQNLTVDPFALERIRSTDPQTHLNEHERRTNVHGAFAVTAPSRIQGKRVLLVDDVYTSGATVEECTRALLYGGAEIVDVFTLAHAITS